MQGPVSSYDFELFNDAASSTGYGAFLGGWWSAERWPAKWQEAGFLKNLVLLELSPVVVAVTIWGEYFCNKRVRLHCDNLGVVQVINSLSGPSPPVIRLLQHLVLCCLQLNIFLYAVQLPGVKNTLADTLSHYQLDRFRELMPGTEQRGTPCLPWLWQIVLRRLHFDSRFLE